MSAALLYSGMYAHVLSGYRRPIEELNVLSLFNGLMVAPGETDPVHRYTRNDISLPGVVHPPNMLSPAEKLRVGVGAVDA